MSKQVDQGTRWESRIVAGAGGFAKRMAKSGIKDEPDVIVPPLAGFPMRPAVAWERWLPGKGRRTAVRTVTITDEHFYELLAHIPYGYYIQCKSRQAGSVSTWLTGLITWMKNREE